MNAQEAIRLTEAALKDTKEEVKEYLNDPFVPEEDKKLMRNDLKAQEIVLESAKELHKLMKFTKAEASDEDGNDCDVYLPEIYTEPYCYDLEELIEMGIDKEEDDE